MRGSEENEDRRRNEKEREDVEEPPPPPPPPPPVPAGRLAPSLGYNLNEDVLGFNSVCFPISQQENEEIFKG